MNDRLSISYIKHFNEFIKDHALEKWRMLISDGHKSHEHYDFIEYCWKHYIIPYPLPPHTTHLMQPLDVACFQPLKHYHRLAIDKAVMLGATKFPLVEFFSIYSRYGVY